MTMHTTLRMSGAQQVLGKLRMYRAVVVEHEHMLQMRTDDYVAGSRAGTLIGDRAASARTEIRSYLNNIASYNEEVHAMQTKLKSLVQRAMTEIEPRPTWRWARLMGYSAAPQNVKRERQRFDSWAQRFAEALRDEDIDDACSLMNDIRSHGGHYNGTIGRMQDAWSGVDNEEICQCENCGTYEPESSDWTYVSMSDETQRWCNTCTEDSAKWSDAMETHIYEHDAVPLYTSESSFDNEDPDDYITRNWARRRGGYTYISHPSSGDNCWVDEDVREYFEEEYSAPPLPGYHCSEDIGYLATEYAKRKDKVYLGLEIELEFGSDGERDRNKCIRAMDREDIAGTYMNYEYDGSLTCGFECVTGYTGLDVHRRELPKLMAVAREYEAYEDDERTGLHVHVSRAGMTPWHAAKLARFIYLPKNRQFIEAVAGRAFGDYREDVDYYEGINNMGQRAQAVKTWEATKSEKFDYVTQGMGMDMSRYAALSFATSTGSTVEFRMFQGTLNADTALACAEFAFACWHFAKQHGWAEMTPHHFVDFVYRVDNRMDTPALRKYLEQVLANPLAINHRNRLATVNRGKQKQAA